MGALRSKSLDGYGIALRAQGGLQLPLSIPLSFQALGFEIVAWRRECATAAIKTSGGELCSGAKLQGLVVRPAVWKYG